MPSDCCLLLLSQIVLPDKMPESALQALIWICVALVVCVVTTMGICLRWMLKHLDSVRCDTKDLATNFSTETTSCRETFRKEAELNRQAFSRDLAAQAASNASQSDKSIAAFERTIDRLAKAVEKKMA